MSVQAASYPIIALMAERGINYADLARGVGMDRVHLWQVLTGRKPLTRRTARALALWLKCSEDELFGPDWEETKRPA